MLTKFLQGKDRAIGCVGIIFHQSLAFIYKGHKSCAHSAKKKKLVLSQLAYTFY